MDPTIIVAIITGAFAVLVALIQLTSSTRGESTRTTPVVSQRLVSAVDFETIMAQRGIQPANKEIAVWVQGQNQIPVAILRRGFANHRVLLPDGTDRKVPASQIKMNH